MPDAASPPSSAPSSVPSRAQRRLVVAGDSAMWRFFGMFGGGALAILLMKLVVGSPPLAALTAGALIGAYAWDIAHRPEAGRGTDVVDSLYYLGFLYTLVSLTATLLWGTAADGGGFDAAAIVGDFGVAITSTMAGMLARIGLTIRRSAPDEGVEDDVRNSVQAAADQLKQQLGYAVVDFEEFREQLRASYRTHADSIRKFAAAMEQATSSAQERADHLIEVAAAGREARDEVAAATKAFVASLHATTDNITGRLRVIRKTHEHLQAFVETAGLAGDQWRSGTARLTEGTAAAASELAAATARIREVDVGADLRKALSDAAASQPGDAAAAAALDALRQAVAPISKGLQDLLRSNAELHAGLLAQARAAARPPQTAPAAPVPAPGAGHGTDPPDGVSFARVAVLGLLVVFTISMMFFLWFGGDLRNGCPDCPSIPVFSRGW